MDLARIAFAAGLALGLVACGGAPDDSSSGSGPIDPHASLPATPSSDGGLAASDAGPHASDAAGAQDSGAAHDASHPIDASAPHDASTSSCPVLAYPSGIHLQTYEDAATTASYAQHLTSGQTPPKCFLDVTRLDDPMASTRYDMTVMVASNFALSELVGTEVNQGYGHFVLAEPEAVASLERFRTAVGVAVSVTSGFRSPRHQEDTCSSLCGNPLGCPGTCANSSRHMWGDAFDLPLAFYTSHDEDLACNAGFKFAYLESGTHLHIDRNPAYATCVKQ